MQIFEIKSKQWFKVIKLYSAAKFEPVEVNHFKVTIVFRFYPN